MEASDPTPAPEPAEDPADAHVMPLDRDEDAINLDPADPRRIEVEQRRGPGFLESLRENS